jgi:hypothetical protein
MPRQSEKQRTQCTEDSANRECSNDQHPERGTDSNEEQIQCQRLRVENAGSESGHKSDDDDQE